MDKGKIWEVERGRAPMLSRGSPPSQHISVFTNQGVPWNLWLWGFCEDFITWPRLIKWLASVIKFNLQPCSFSQRSGPGAENTNPPITWLVFLVTISILKLPDPFPSIVIVLPHKGKFPAVLWALCQNLGQRPITCFLLYHSVNYEHILKLIFQRTPGGCSPPQYIFP